MAITATSTPRQDEVPHCHIMAFVEPRDQYLQCPLRMIGRNPGCNVAVVKHQLMSQAAQWDKPLANWQKWELQHSLSQYFSRRTKVISDRIPMACLVFLTKPQDTSWDSLIRISNQLTM